LEPHTPRARPLGSNDLAALLQLLIVPLIVLSVFTGVTSIGDYHRLGRLGGWALFYYISTMFIAVALGLVLVTTLEPGVVLKSTLVGSTDQFSIDPKLFAAINENAAGGLVGVFANIVSLVVPRNFFEALASNQTLGVIAATIFFAIATLAVGERAKPLIALGEVAFEVVMKMVAAVLWLAPIGIFALMAWTVARIGLGVFADAIGHYMITVTAGLLLHGLVVLPAILLLVARVNPFCFMKQMRASLITAFGTDSSIATLPVTIKAATEEGGVDKQTANLVLPLGATVNMDGTALYEAVAVVFLAQAFGVELGTTELIIVAITATLAAIGAAGIPSAGLVTMVIVVEAVNSSLAASGVAGAVIPVAGIGLIIGVDRLLDMLRTVVNVWGDAVGAKIISVRLGGDPTSAS